MPEYVWNIIIPSEIKNTFCCLTEETFPLSGHSFPLQDPGIEVVIPLLDHLIESPANFDNFHHLLITVAVEHYPNYFQNYGENLRSRLDNGIFSIANSGDRCGQELYCCNVRFVSWILLGAVFINLEDKIKAHGYNSQAQHLAYNYDEN